MAKKEIMLTIPDEIIMNQIYFIRGQKVIIDRDIAELYGVETKKLKQAVKRNIDRFPEDFMFELTLIEFEILRSQIVTSRFQHAVYVICQWLLQSRVLQCYQVF